MATGCSVESLTSPSPFVRSTCKFAVAIVYVSKGAMQNLEVIGGLGGEIWCQEWSEVAPDFRVYASHYL